MEKYLELLDREKMPHHVAVIMDGNGRWAQKRGMPRLFGHRQGVETVERVVRACVKLGIAQLTIYAFSTENWKRPQEEVAGLMRLLVEYFDKKTDQLNEEGVRIQVIGDVEALSDLARQSIARAEEKTKNNERLGLNIAINYGGRAEIVRAVKRIARQVQDGVVAPDDIDDEMVSQQLYTKELADPDLMIRTGGEMRISNFLIWQLSYAELWFTETYWPDFDIEILAQAVYAYQNRDRRFGGLKS